METDETLSIMCADWHAVYFFELGSSLTILSVGLGVRQTLWSFASLHYLTSPPLYLTLSFILLSLDWKHLDRGHNLGDAEKSRCCAMNNRLYRFIDDATGNNRLSGGLSEALCIYFCFLVSFFPSVRYLLRNNVSPDLCNEDGLTALHQVRSAVSICSTIFFLFWNWFWSFDEYEETTIKQSIGTDLYL